LRQVRFSKFSFGVTCLFAANYRPSQVRFFWAEYLQKGHCKL